MSFKALKILFAALILTFAVSAFAEESKDDKPAFPGKPGLEFKQTIHSGSNGNKIGNPKDSITGTVISEAGVYSKTEFKGQIAFSVIDKLYTITPWAKERLDVYFEPSALITGISQDASNDVTATSKNGALVNARNRFEVGFDNTINIDKMIKITINPAFRVENNLTRKAADKVNKESFYPAVKFSFMPSLNLGYSYSVGFSWALNNTVYLHMYPVMDQVTNDSILESVEYEGTYNIAFNIMKPLKIKDYGLSIFAEEYVYIVNKTENYKNKKFSYDGKTDYVDSGSTQFDNKIGLKGSFYGIGLFANSMIRTLGRLDNIDANASNVYAGVQAGGTVKVDKFDFGITYTGLQQVWMGEAKNDSGKYEPRAVKDTDNLYWNNLVEGYFRIKF